VGIGGELSMSRGANRATGHPELAMYLHLTAAQPARAAAKLTIRPRHRVTTTWRPAAQRIAPPTRL